MNLKDAARKVLDAYDDETCGRKQFELYLGVLNDALKAQPVVAEQHKQEPVAWMTTEVTTGTQVWLYKKTAERYQNPPTPLFTTPPQCKPLTIDQIASIAIDRSKPDGIVAFVRAVEAAHGIKE